MNVRSSNNKVLLLVMTTLTLLVCLLLSTSCYSKMIVTSLKSQSNNSIDNNKYLPVIIMHGFDGHIHMYQPIADYIQEYNPGTNVYLLTVDPDMDSVIKAMNEQLIDMENIIFSLKKENNFTNFHFICHSQGGLLCRSFIQRNQNHGVKNFISLTGAQFGQFGIPSGMRLYPFLQHVTTEEAYLILYTNLLQKVFSVANYWKDPHHLTEYSKVSEFLAIYNNETNTVDYASKYKFRENFLKIDKFIITGSPDDEIITPYQSALFGFYNEKEVIVPMENQTMYIRDSFGLKTLNNEKRLIKFEIPGVKHSDWLSRKSLFLQCILPYLY
ncbi:hypothetical protein ABK040_006992 [Willaertia magna]